MNTFFHSGKRLLWICMFFSLTKGYNQTGHEVLQKQDFNFGGNLMSPQAFSFTKYGGHKVSLSTGQIWVDIPIYSYNDNNFNIPVYIAYNSPGFMPNQREGIVGLGWSLNAGGAITRVVNGVPDDSYNFQDIGGYYQLNGLLYGIKNNLAIKTTSKSNIFNLSAGSVSQNLYWNIGTCEAEPDLFSFNVPGLSGKFYIENNGEVRTIGNKPFKIDLSGVGIQLMRDIATSEVENSSISIITDDGYKYDFGGNTSFLEVAFNLYPSNEVFNPVINSWHLKKITAPNGQIVEYKYKPFNSDLHQENGPNDGFHYLFNVNHIRNSRADEYAYAGGAYVAGSSASVTTSKSVTKTIYLEEILVNNRASIKFDYVQNENKFYQDPDNVNNDFNQYNLRIKKIAIRDYKLNTRKEFQFDYAYLGGTESRLFLTSLTESGKAPFTFNYYNTSNLPSPLTGSIDHWGFWNGSNNTYQAVIPQIDYSVNGDETITDNKRDPDTTKCKTAMLEQITYPTSGYSKFDYQAHEYHWRLERKNDFNFLPNLYEVSGNTGGARIARIEEYDGIKVSNVREFIYKKDYPAGNISSGVLLQWPRYLFYWENVVPGTATTKHLRIRSTSFNNTYSGNEHYIQYSEVTEKMVENGYTNYLFTDYISNPDENSYNTIKLDPTLFDGITNKHLHNSYVGIYFNDKSFERGIQKSVRYFKYDENDDPVLIKETKTNLFTSSSDFPDFHIAGAHMTGGIVQSFKKYYYPFLPKQVEETTYSLSGGVSNTVVHDYHYNGSGYLVRHTTTGSNGVPVSSMALYPEDFPAGTIFLDDMKNNNLLKFPIERVKYNETNGTKYILSGQIVKYKESGKGQIDEVMDMENPGKIPMTNFKFSNRSTGILPPAGSSTGFSPDSKYHANLIIDSYDDAGNPNEQHKVNDISHSFIWDYHSRYLVAEATNASQSDIAYTSFESDGKGNWTFSGTPFRELLAPTGKKAYDISSGYITRSVNSATTYIISYWRPTSLSALSIAGTISGYPISGRTVNGWKYYEHKVSGQNVATISGSGSIDELRLYPVTAQMTTYTYEPLIGMTSQCDASNRITYYEYDGFGRLALVKDQSKNVLKKLCYNYAGQPEDCLTYYYNEEKSGSFARDCGAGYNGSSVIYTVAANSYNSTISQEAADLLAQNDVDANGQAYANTNGTCQRIPIAVTLKNSGEQGQQTFYVNFTANEVSSHFGFINKTIASGASYTNNVYWGTYDIEIEVKSGDNLKFSLNGQVKTGSIVTYINVSITDAMTIYAGVYQNTTQNVNYTRNDCPPNNTPSTVVYVVAPNIYTSFISQADANTQAISQTASAGQLYANANGTCLPPIPPTTDIVYTNQMPKTITLKLTNTLTGILYTFSLPKKTTPTTAGTIPTGVYNVTMKVNGESEYYSINSYVQAIPDTDFSATNVLLNTAITTVTAY